MNTYPILKHLTYLLTCFISISGSCCIFFVKSRRFYLNKYCELKQASSIIILFLNEINDDDDDDDQTIIDNAIDEWYGRLRACVRAKDGHVEQLLSTLNFVR